ncbi:MAG: LuxR C-terminal-related transcriptional regulator, partial [Firmicutes bacterium]|nr:LuxR C-terminal-related transcriptional regulator [Bacillota bacterium]
IIFYLLKKHGLTQESFEFRKSLRAAIKAKSKELELSERERYLLELVVLDGYTAEQLPDKMMLSRNTIRAQSRNLLQKLDIGEISELRQYFEEIVRKSLATD